MAVVEPDERLTLQPDLHYSQALSEPLDDLGAPDDPAAQWEPPPEGTLGEKTLLVFPQLTHPCPPSYLVGLCHRTI